VILNRLPHAAILTLLSLTAWCQAQDAPPPEPNIAGRKLMPVDESASDSSFLAFKLELEKVVRAKDKARLSKDFIDVEFAHRLDDDPDDLERWWERLAEVFRLGIAHDRYAPAKFVGPSLLQRFPDDLAGDCGEDNYVVIAGSDVAVRKKPSPTAPVIATLSYQLVKVAPGAPGVDGLWRAIEIPDKQVGYVSRRLTLNNYDTLTVFSKINGRWLIEETEESCQGEIDSEDVAWVRQGSKYDQTFTLITDFKVIIYARTTITGTDGSGKEAALPRRFQMEADSHSRSPESEDKLPDLPLASTFLGLDIFRTSQPIAVYFPNTAKLPPGTKNIPLINWDSETTRATAYGTGTVSADGKQIVPDPDPAHPGHLYGPTRIGWLGALLPAKFRTQKRD